MCVCVCAGYGVCLPYRHNQTQKALVLMQLTNLRKHNPPRPITHTQTRTAVGSMRVKVLSAPNTHSHTLNDDDVLCEMRM